MRKEALRMERVTFEERGVTMLDNFNFQVFSGEVMGLIPLDSLGLEVFISLLQTNHSLVYGYVYLQEQLVNTFSGSAQVKNNVIVISNESNLVQYMSAAENVFALRRGYKARFINTRILRQQLKILLEEVGMEMDPDKPLMEMTLFERYIIEIIKAVVSVPDVIVLQDPSSAINHDDQQRLHQVIRYYADRGNTFIYISVHREELVQVCDRVSLMAQGRIVKVAESHLLTEELMSHYADPLPFSQRNNVKAENRNVVEQIFRFENVHYNNIRGLSFKVYKGECLAIHDYENQICEDLVNLIAAEKPEKGGLFWRGESYRRKHQRKTAVILENPVKNMLYGSMSYEDNLCITLDHLFGEIWRRKRMRKSIAREIMGEELPNLKTRVKDLTIRQQYQLLYTRVLLQKPDLVFCIHPYLNTDFELQQYVQSLMRSLLERGISVVIIVVNIRDALMLADRLLLVKDGRNCGVLSREEFEYLIEEKYTEEH